MGQKYVFRAWLSDGPRSGVTKAPFVNFVVKETYLSNISVKVFETLSYFTRVTAAEPRRHMSKYMNVIFNQCFDNGEQSQN